MATELNGRDLLLATHDDERGREVLADPFTVRATTKAHMTQPSESNFESNMRLNEAAEGGYESEGVLDHVLGTVWEAASSYFFCSNACMAMLSWMMT